MGMRTLLLAAALAALLAGCGDDDNPVEGGAIGLTEWLPRDAITYTLVDIAAYKEELELSEDADPTRVPGLEPAALGHFSSLLVEPPPLRPNAKGDKSLPSGAVIEAVDPAAVTSAATSEGPHSSVTAFATLADTGEIGSRLGDLGYRDDGGVLVRGEAEPAIRLEEGLVFASEDPEALRAIPDEQRDDPPLSLLAELDGEDTAVWRMDDRCFTESAATMYADGTAEVAVLVPGGAEAERMEPDTGEVGEADADGDVVVKPVIEPEKDASARVLLNELWPGYDCD